MKVVSNFVHTFLFQYITMGIKKKILAIGIR